MAKENQNNLTGNPVKKINFKVDSPYMKIKVLHI